MGVWDAQPRAFHATAKCANRPMVASLTTRSAALNDHGPFIQGRRSNLGLGFEVVEHEQ